MCLQLSAINNKLITITIVKLEVITIKDSEWKANREKSFFSFDWEEKKFEPNETNEADDCYYSLILLSQSLNSSY